MIVIDNALTYLGQSAAAVQGAATALMNQGVHVTSDQVAELHGALGQVLALIEELQSVTREGAPPERIAKLQLLARGTSQHADQLAARAYAASSGLGGKAAGDLAEANGAARQLADRAQRALFDDKIFDASLRFGSPAEEEDYRRREAERRAMLDGLDPNDPRHERNRLLIQRDQLQDAIAHGADRDPRAHDLQREINEMLRRQRDAAIAAGADPREFDAADQALRQRFPKGGQRFEEKGAYLGRRAHGDAAVTGGEKHVAARTEAAAQGAKAAVKAAIGQDVDVVDGAFQEEPSPVQRAADQLKAAGVTPAADAAPAAPARTVLQASIEGGTRIV